MSIKIKATLTNGSASVLNKSAVSYNTYDAGIKFWHKENKTYGTLTAIVNMKELTDNELEEIRRIFKCPVTWNKYCIVIVRASSSCCPEDKYDKTVGERIVESRCKEKLYKKIQKILTMVNDYNRCRMYEFDVEAGRYFHLGNVERHHILELIK